MRLHLPKSKTQTKNDDPLIISFTSGTTGHPKMVVLDCVYPLAHIVTARYWHNLHEKKRASDHCRYRMVESRLGENFTGNG